IVVLELDDGTVDYKVFSKSADAIARYERAFEAQRDGTPVITRKGADETMLLSCKMFKANTADVREAARLVKEGKAEPFSRPLSDREERDLQTLSKMLELPSDTQKPD